MSLKDPLLAAILATLSSQLLSTWMRITETSAVFFVWWGCFRNRILSDKMLIFLVVFMNVPYRTPIRSSYFAKRWNGQNCLLRLRIQCFPISSLLNFILRDIFRNFADVFINSGIFFPPFLFSKACSQRFVPPDLECVAFWAFLSALGNCLDSHWMIYFFCASTQIFLSLKCVACF